MTNNGPQGFDAYTTWNFQYTWDSKQVSVSGQITKPKVKSQCSGAVSAFKKYYRRLYQHEFIMFLTILRGIAVLLKPSLSC